MKEFILAAQLAANSKNTKKNFYLACVALRKDGVIVTSTNQTTVENRAPSGHAEARALRKCGKNSVIWIARVLKNNTWALAKPCKHCRSLIINHGVKKVFYTIGPNEYGIWRPQEKALD